MATTQISDIIEPSVFLDYVVEQTPVKSRFFNSGIVNYNEFGSLAEGGGRTVDMPFWHDLSGDSNVDDDDPDERAVPEKATAASDVAFKHNRNYLLQGADLAAIVAGSDPLRVLGDRVIAYWDREYQKFLIQSALGVLADNQLNDSGDMVYSIASDSEDPVTDGERISGDAMVEAMQTMGDSKADLVAIALHSRVHANLQKLGLLQDHHDLETGALMFQTFMGKRVILDDGMPAVPGDNRISYTSILFGAGAFGHGEGTPRVPVASDRDEKGGNGGGIEWFVNRRKFILHPRGIAWQGSSMAGKGPTNSELASGTNWDRVYERQNVRIAYLRSNG